MKSLGNLEKVTPLSISGWAVTDQAESPVVEVYVNGVVVSRVECSILRKDVIERHGNKNKFNGFQYFTGLKQGDIVHVTLNGFPLRASPTIVDGHAVSGEITTLDSLSKTSDKVEKLSLDYSFLKGNKFPTAIYKISNGKVNSNGVVFVDGYCVKESLVLFSERKGGFFSSDSMVFNYPYSKSHLLRGNHASLAMYGVQNYYHFIFDLIFRGVLFDLVRENLRTDSYILSAFESEFQEIIFSKVFDSSCSFLESDSLYDFDVLYIMNPVRKDFLYNQESLSILSDRLKQNFLPNVVGLVKPKKIYISREFQGGRRLINELELICFLKKRGFEIVHPEKLSLTEQAHLFSQAIIIVSCSGAALTNLIYCDSRCTVMEIIPNSSTKRQSHFFWGRFCESFGLKHIGFYSDIYEQNDNIHLESFIINIDSFFSIYDNFDKEL